MLAKSCELRRMHFASRAVTIWRHAAAGADHASISGTAMFI